MIFALEARVTHKSCLKTAASFIIGSVEAAPAAFRLGAWGSLSVPYLELPFDVPSRKDLIEVLFPQVLTTARAEVARAALFASKQWHAQIR